MCRLCHDHDLLGNQRGKFQLSPLLEILKIQQHTLHMQSIDGDMGA